MQIRKTYREINPELLYAEIRDFAAKEGAILKEAKLETYTLPDESANFVSRGTLIFRQGNEGKAATAESLRVHVVGSSRVETKLMIDLDESLFPESKITAIMADVDFIFGSYEEAP